MNPYSSLFGRRKLPVRIPGVRRIQTLRMQHWRREVERCNAEKVKVLQDTDSADAALAEREGFEPPMGLHP